MKILLSTLVVETGMIQKNIYLVVMNSAFTMRKMLFYLGWYLNDVHRLGAYKIFHPSQEGYRRKPFSITSYSTQCSFADWEQFFKDRFQWIKDNNILYEIVHQIYIDGDTPDGEITSANARLGLFEFRFH